MIEGLFVICISKAVIHRLRRFLIRGPRKWLNQRKGVTFFPLGRAKAKTRRSGVVQAGRK
jgi:hypothetical protein